MKSYITDYGGRPLEIQVGKMAKQANGSCTVKYGDTLVLVTACRATKFSEGSDFLPLTVNYVEMTYAAGKIPGGFFKREGRPSEKEVLCSRLIDRPLRPLFPSGYFFETQVIATVMSFDSDNDAEIAALIGASTALKISDIPFDTSVSMARVGRINGELVCNPSFEARKESDIDLIVAGTADAIIMVEGGANFLGEDEMLAGMEFAHESMQSIFKLQEEIAEDIGKEKIELEKVGVDPAIVSEIRKLSEEEVRAALQIPFKHERYEKLDQILSGLVATVTESHDITENNVKSIFNSLKYEILRARVLDEGVRIDGRGVKQIRPITCESGILPRAHGSALFTRGETQALVATTLGTSDDQQRIDAFTGWEYKNFILHYNFPPFCVGEVKFLRSPGRREIGHGALAERAVARSFPSADDFPYTVRVVSEVLESNGSSSMATVCGASMSLMDAGVPVNSAIAGIAMGLIMEGERYAVLSDILGDEDHLGDMDFKVAGNEDGITAFQMDTKIGGIPMTVLREAMFQAREGRLHILECMKETIAAPRPDISAYAPRIITLNVAPDKVRDVIGPGGKTIRGIIEQTGVKIDIDDTGRINIASSDEEAADMAVEIVKKLTEEAEVGKVYNGLVKKIMDFGAFVEILPGKDGLLHISQLENRHVKNVRDVLSEGDEVTVKVLEIDRVGKIRLSRKVLLDDN